MQPERRFEGTMSADYLLIRLLLPNFEELQRLVAEEVAAGPPTALRVLDLGCGDGATSGSILSGCPGVQITALDSEAGMVRQATENLAGAIREGRCRVILGDALDDPRGQPEGSFDVVASALALHNLAGDYRHALHQTIYRATPGGRFVNADKYTADDEQRFERLRRTLTAFFDVFVPLGRLDLLRAAVLHEVADDGPGRLMREADTLHELSGIGFCDVVVKRRLPMATLLVARRKA